ncbi:helix-turn-helix transcriptional regulator [Paenibacillus aestuarii]|uniref:Helix-turn-helix transcriptional regulator n=1 Tax=Paenibacillus aestuarii TaxID=516965 RepID=A0ABW0K453_9BACL|nr:YafY family protein [Paenibacillus aestuarii]
MNKTQRLIQLMLTVNERMQFTLKEMADEFGVSERTMHRDLQELSEMGMPLYTEFGPHGGYRVLKKRMLPPILFSEQEAVAMFFAFQSLQYYRALPFEAETASALNKFYHYLPADAKAKIDAMKDRVVFWTPYRTTSSPYLQQIMEAALEGKALNIDYASKNGARPRVIQPIGLYANQGYWYMPAYCFEREKNLLFRCDRILALAPAEDSHPVREIKSMTITEWLRKAPADGSRVTLRVRLTPEGVQMYERGQGMSGSLQKQPDGSAILLDEMHEENMGHFSQYFLSFGGNAIVEEPEAMVTWIREQVQAMAKAYGG